MKKSSWLAAAAVVALAAAALMFSAAAVTRTSAAPVVGERLDNGLGDLPHYREWKDKTGRDPMGRQQLGHTS